MIRDSFKEIVNDCEYYGCAWSVIRVYTVSAVSNNRLLTEVDVECSRCKAQRYVVSSGNVLEDGEDIPPPRTVVSSGDVL